MKIRSYFGTFFEVDSVPFQVEFIDPCLLTALQTREMSDLVVSVKQLQATLETIRPFQDSTSVLYGVSGYDLCGPQTYQVSYLDDSPSNPTVAV